MSPILQLPLDIPNVTIENVETTTQGHRVITVRSTVLGTSCHQCGQEITKLYGGDRAVILRHLPILGKKTGRVLDLDFPFDVWHANCHIWREKPWS